MTNESLGYLVVRLGKGLRYCRREVEESRVSEERLTLVVCISRWCLGFIDSNRLLVVETSAASKLCGKSAGIIRDVRRFSGQTLAVCSRNEREENRSAYTVPRLVLSLLSCDLQCTGLFIIREVYVPVCTLQLVPSPAVFKD